MAQQNGIGAGPRPVAMRPAAAQAGAVALSPKEVFAIIRRHVFLIIFMTILGLVAGGGAWYLLKKYSPKYTAQTFLRVLSPVVRDPMTIGGGPASKDIQYGHRLSMANLIKRQSMLQDLIQKEKVQQTKWFSQFGQIRAERMRQAVQDLEKNLGANALRDADFIVLSMTCGDAEEAALIVNEMLDLFIASQGSVSREDVADKLARLEEQRIRIQRDLDAADRSLEEVRTRWGITDLGEEGVRYAREHTFTLKLNQLELEQNDLLMQINQTQAAIRTLERQATGPINEQVENMIETDPIMVMLAQQRANLETQLGGALTKFGENHRFVKEVRERIEQVKEKRLVRRAEIAEQVRQSNLQDAQDTMIVLHSRLEELNRLREEAAAKKKDLDLARVQYAQRSAIRDERREMLAAIKAQIEKLRIMHDDPETPKVQFVGYAPVPLGISSPKLVIYFPGGTMLGLMFGVGLAFLIELLNDLVRTPADVARYLHVRLLGMVPHADEDELAADVDPCCVVQRAPYSILSESYRSFRTNLKLSEAERSRTILVSSGMPGEGKTSVAVNLASSLAVESAVEVTRVLLIDANFRRPALHKVFPAGGEPQAVSKAGLSTFLTGRCGIEQVIRPSGVDSCDIIEAGPAPANPAELLGGARMAELINVQRERYDYIIIDGPPVFLVTDAKVLAKLVDATVLVFNAAMTRRGAAVRTIRELRQVGAEIAGCVLLAVRALKGGYFQEQIRSFQKYQLELAGAAKA